MAGPGPGTAYRSPSADCIDTNGELRKSAPHYHRSAAGGVIGGKFYVVGGVNSADLDVYDPATDSWRTRALIPKAGRAIGTTLGGTL